MQTIKQLQLITNYTTLNDSNTGELSKTQISEGIKNWELGRGANSELLNNELPSEVFNQKIKQVETEVYKNNIGFSIKLTHEFLFSKDEQGNEISCLSLKDEVVHLNAGNNFDVILKYKNKGKCDLYCSSSDIADILDIDLQIGYKAILSWNLTDVTHHELETTIAVFDLKGKFIDKKIFPGKIPYPDVSERNLSLLHKIEQKLLIVEEENNENQVFNFEHNNEFFVYRTELKTTLIKKCISVQAVSPFKSFTPKKKDGFLSDESKLLILLIRNNTPPLLPIYQITPLVFTQ
nr:hypothetical protein [Bacteroidota bacterium]